jgi:(p)ppGpp synthase/HD superfamily hydrolase
MAAEVSSIKDLTKSLKTYMDSDQLEQVKKAFFFAANAHSGQYRVSGDPYVTHPVAVAEILAKFKMDGDSLSAAMLHDVIEDSGSFDVTRVPINMYHTSATELNPSKRIIVTNIERDKSFVDDLICV